MKPRQLLTATDRFARENSPEILTAFGVSGVVATAYLAGRTSWVIGQDKMADELESGVVETNKDLFKRYWRQYIPAVITGTTTIGCIVMATKVNSKRTAALTMAYSLSDRAYHEYRDKVLEQFGETKEQAVRDAIAQDHADKAPSRDVVVMGTGDVLCCEQYTGRYFLSDMESIRRAVNIVNRRINTHDIAPLSDFYEQVGLEFNEACWELGWNTEKLLELDFSSAITPDGKPCITFTYNYITTL